MPQTTVPRLPEVNRDLPALHSTSESPLGQQETSLADLPLSYYWFLLMRSRWQVITFTLVMTTVITLLTLTLPKEYDASVLLRVDPQHSNVVGDNQSALNGGSTDASFLVATEAKVITSPAVVNELIQKLDLVHNPEFSPQKNDAQIPTSRQINEVMKAVTKDISVNQPNGTLLLDISFRCHDPQLAATAANALAEVFLEHEYATRARALTDSSKYMADQLDTLRAQMERAQSALVTYESTHDVIDPDDKNNIYEARLGQINSDLSTAESKRMQIQAEYGIARSSNIDALMVTSRGQALVPLQQRLQADQRLLGKLATVYGPNHPIYIQQKKVVEVDRQQLQKQAQHIADQVDNQYRAASDREKLIRSALNQEKRAMDAFNMRAIRYHSLKAAADSATKLYYDLQQRIQDATVAAGLHSEDLRIISPARPSTIPVFPRPVLFGFLSFIGSMLIGITAVIGKNLMDKTVSTPEQVELRFQARVISSLPLVNEGEKGGLRILDEDGPQPAILSSGSNDNINAIKRHSAFHESILALHSALQFSSAEPLRVIVLTSSIPGEGKSTVSSHLATTFSAMGTNTVLIDADMRKPNIHRIFHTSNLLGLSSILRQKRDLDEVLQDRGPNLTLLPAGPAPSNPAELLNLGMSALVEQLRERFDLVIIDCPPALAFADASIVANLADGYLLIIGAGSTDQGLIAASLRQLNSVRANLLGVILNRVSAKLDGYYSYYKDYYRAYYNADSDNDVAED